MLVETECGDPWKYFFEEPWISKTDPIFGKKYGDLRILWAKKFAKHLKIMHAAMAPLSFNDIETSLSTKCTCHCRSRSFGRERIGR